MKNSESPPGEPERDPGADLLVPTQPRDVHTGPIDELLEHQRVLRLLDDLVVHVPELRRTVRQPERVQEQTALQHVLELAPDLHGAGEAVQTELRAHRRGLLSVPIGVGDAVPLGQLESRIRHVDGHLGVVPRDVGIGVVMTVHRLATESGDECVEHRTVRNTPGHPLQRLAVLGDGQLAVLDRHVRQPFGHGCGVRNFVIVARRRSDTSRY